MEKEPDLYRYILTLSIRITHCHYDEKSNTGFIRPIFAFTNKENAKIVIEREITLIPENCKVISHKDTFLDSPKHEFSIAIETKRAKYEMEGKDDLAVYNNFESSLKFVKKSNFFPSI